MNPDKRQPATAKAAPIRILIVDDNDLIREEMRRWLQARPRFQVVGEARDGLEAVRLVAKSQPDVVLMDISMPHLNGLEATAQVTQQFPRTRVIIHTSSTAAADVRRALEAGAAAYLVKGGDMRPDVVIENVAAGNTFVDPSVSRETLDIRLEPASIGAKLAGHSAGETHPVPATAVASGHASVSDDGSGIGYGIRLLSDACFAKAGQPLRIVMVNGDNIVLTYLWHLTVFFCRFFPMALHEWTHWSFADLETPITVGVATGAVAVADWVVFCQATSAPLPPHVQSWIERCLERKGENKATLGLLTLSHDRNGTNHIQTYLKEAASRTGTRFMNVQDCLCLSDRAREQKPPASATVEVPYD